MKKVSSAIVLASLSALAQQAHAQKEINIDSKKVSSDLTSSLSSTLNQKDPSVLISNNLADFGDHFKIDSKGIDVDVRAYLAAYQDSTNSGSEDVMSSICYTNCYSNCHSACHGSRSWR
jgi:hypothetical protein